MPEEQKATELTDDLVPKRADTTEPVDGLTASEKLEYETCTSLIVHYENLRMGLLQFFAVFNGALLALIPFAYNQITGLGNAVVIVIIGLFASLVCLMILNGEIREMSYWTAYAMRARKIEEETNSRKGYSDTASGKGFMDTYRGTYREIVKAKEFLSSPETGYGKPQSIGVFWGSPLARILGGSRRSGMPVFYAFVAVGWLGFSSYGIFLLHDCLWRLVASISLLAVVVFYVRAFRSGIGKSYLNLQDGVR